MTEDEDDCFPSARRDQKTERKRERNLGPANSQRRQGLVKQLGGYWRRVNGRRRRIWGLKVRKEKKDDFAAGRSLTNPDRSRWPWPELKPRASTAASRAFLPLAASGWHGQELSEGPAESHQGAPKASKPRGKRFGRREVAAALFLLQGTSRRYEPCT